MTEGAAGFARMALALHEEATLEKTLERLLEFAIKAVGCEHAGVIFVNSKRQVKTLAATHPVVASLDKVQFDCGEGPDLEVVDDDHYSVSVPDTAADTRWPDWCRAVAGAGLGSMLGIRLQTVHATIGSLNLYAVEKDAFSVEARDVADILAQHASIALDTARDTENLWEAIDARRLIGQAQGIVMERYQVDAERAFEVLRRYSQDRNIKLQKVAHDLVETGRLPI